MLSSSLVKGPWLIDAISRDFPARLSDLCPPPGRSAMARPTPPGVQEIEEDLARAPRTDPVFALPPTPGEARGSGRDEATTVAEQAVQFVVAYDQLQEDGARSLPATLAAVERHIRELRTIIRAPSNK